VSRWERWLQYAANLLVGGSGVLYAAMRYFMEPADEWAVVNHPWQPHVQHFHVLAAPLLIFACGAIWRRHVVEHWKRATRLRRTGPGLAILFVPMIVSGYLLQTTVSAGWRQAWIVIHVASSTIWLGAFALHLLGAWQRSTEGARDRLSRRSTRHGAVADRAS
jgi:hypothetical protein